MKRYLNVKNISSIAVLGALGAVLMIFDFPIGVAPGFYKLDISDLPCLIGAFALGPVPALFIQVIKILVKLLIKPTSTAFVGELAAFIFSSAFCVTAAFIYSRRKDKKNAMTAIIVGSLAMVIVAAAGNYLFIIPAYVEMFHMPVETIVELGSKIFPAVHDKFSFVLCCVVPFNLIKAAIVDILTIIMYKHISPLLH